ncbi:sodium/pantothenate symporter [Mycobacterium sp. NAZ190054]|uniref:sodium/pantothenate symporter n=1 Tax=Mycobacterium sp. NAZ190054 TaxID=1747766 RepID=UPI00079B68CC|nr:sodium/pantothenate symporter [Mycobacterium sp. NAZ190054]KWX68488.1 hypothetical protein ASJ79_17585 [Mycobacterium sp. NAZ190054]
MDWTLLFPFAVYLLVVLLVGVYGFNVIAGKKASEFSEEFYVGSRSLGGWTLALTFAASLGSAGSFLGTPALAYSVGFSWLVIGALQSGSIAVGLGLLGKRIAIVGRKIKAYTLPQILEARYPGAVMRYVVPVLITVFLTVFMVSQVVGGARVLEAMAGVPYHLGALAVGAITVAYTVLGGFRAASITDLVQGIFMALGSVLLVVLIVGMAGGLGPIVDSVEAANPALISPDGGGELGSLFILSSGGLLLGIALLSMPHAAVRGFAFKDSRALHKAMVIGTVAAITFTVVIWFAGAAGHHFLGEIEAPDQVIPLLAKELFPSLAAGIFLAVPFAAIMSTVDSVLLVVCSSLVEDIYVKAKNGDVDPRRRMVLNRASMGVIGTLVVLLALNPPELLTSLVFFAVGGLASCLLFPLLFGLYWPRANTPGAVASCLGGGVAYLLFAQVLDPMLAADPIFWSLAVSLVLMVGVSLATAKPERAVLQAFWGRADTGPEQALAQQPVVR